MTCHISYKWHEGQIYPTFVAWCTYPIMGFGERLEDYGLQAGD